MAEKMNTILRNQSGAALVIALIMIIVITLIALASSYTSIFEMAMSGNKRGTTDAFYVADAGINAIMAYPTISFFNPTGANWQYVLPANTSTWYDPLYDKTVSPSILSLTLPNLPAGSITPGSSTNPTVIYYTKQSGPPRGGGYSAVNVGYAYFQVQCTGNDSAGSGAQATAQEEVIEIIPIAQ